MPQARGAPPDKTRQIRPLAGAADIESSSEHHKHSAQRTIGNCCVPDDAVQQ